MSYCTGTSVYECTINRRDVMRYIPPTTASAQQLKPKNQGYGNSSEEGTLGLVQSAGISSRDDNERLHATQACSAHRVPFKQGVRIFATDPRVLAVQVQLAVPRLGHHNGRNCRHPHRLYTVICHILLAA